MRYLFAAALLVLTAQPSWAPCKWVSAAGSTSFQEQPCERAQTQTAIKPLIEAPRAGQAGEEGPAQSPAPVTRPSIQEQNRQAEAERLRFDATYALRDKLAEQARHRDACDAQQKRIPANREVTYPRPA